TILKNQLSFFLKICYLSNDIFHGKPTSFVAVYELKTKVLCVVQMMQGIYKTLVTFFIGRSRSKFSPFTHPPQIIIECSPR
ncbi:hypothetical protein, partial [Ruminococcus bicirculans (ex Wegman et al. 2014)]|uniref:hypothetical protein n=1 Tax=Ruminococcus bicirculans (ex Wegman et al. 2014) TaxID=1160721 RepID=UPI003FD8A9AF